MPQSRIPCPSFVGGTDLAVSRQVATQRSINTYPERVNSQGNKVEAWLRPVEGIDPFGAVIDVDTSELFYQDDHAYGVCGTSFFEYFADGTTIVRGAVAYRSDTKATICSNGSAGQQICVTSGWKLYIWDLDTELFTNVTALGTGPLTGINILMCEFMDGYFFALERGSRRVYYSALEDGLTWDTAFGYIERSWGSDNISFIKRSGRQLWLVGTKTSEVWVDNGDAEIPFAPIQGAFLDIGSMAPFSGCRDGDTLTWLSQSEQGGGLVVRATGYQPEVESHYGIASIIQVPAADMPNAEAFVCQIGGHVLYWLYIPGLETTLVYDFTEQKWHERAMWNTAFAHWEPHVARCHAYAFQKNIVGVRTTGVIYELSARFLENTLVAA